jgi:hypothetical protein
MNITADATTPARPRHLRLRRRGRAGRARAVVEAGRAPRLPHLARDRGGARHGARRLDARRRLGADAARPDDEPPPRAGRGLVRGPDRERRRRASTSRRTRAGRSTTSASTSSSARRSATRSRTASSARMYRDATVHRDHAGLLGSLDAVAGPRRVDDATASRTCGKGQPGQHAHVSHGAVAGAVSGTSRSAVRS